MRVEHPDLMVVKVLLLVQETPMTDLDATLAQARAYAAHSYSANTHAAYASDWKLFSAEVARAPRRVGGFVLGGGGGSVYTRGARQWPPR